MKASQRAYALLILLFILSFGYWIGGAVSLYEELRFGPAHARLPLGFGFRMQTITGITPEAREAGAHVGDTLLQFNGQPFTGYYVMRDAVLDSRPDSLIPAVIQHPDGTVARIAIRLAPQRQTPARVSEWLRDIGVQLVFRKRPMNPSSQTPAKAA